MVPRPFPISPSLNPENQSVLRRNLLFVAKTED